MKSPYAGVGRRALATFIDAFPLSFIFVVMVLQFGEFDFSIDPNDRGTTRQSFFHLSGTGFLMLFLFSAFYQMGMELTFGGTIGKLMTGLRVRNADGSPLSIKGALLRFVFLPIDSIGSYLLAAIMVWSTSKNQRLGDLVGGTIVGYREFVQSPTALPHADSTSWQTY